MDDGCFIEEGGLKIATNSFTLKEVELLCKILNNKYNLVCFPNKTEEKDQYIINIYKQSLNDLQNIVREYIHPIFKYKIKL